MENGICVIFFNLASKNQQKAKKTRPKHRRAKKLQKTERRNMINTLKTKSYKNNASQKIAKHFCCLIVFSFALISCGSKNKPTHHQPTLGSPIEQAFSQAERTYSTPSRILMAVSYLESQLSANSATSYYGSQLIGPAVGETAFGLSKQKLGLLQGSQRIKLTNQIDAYARWLSGKITENLPKNPRNPDEIFLWIWEIAQLHRKKSNTRVLFALELISILNSGYQWQDPETNEMMEFKAERKQIDISQLSRNAQKTLRLDTRQSEIKTASMLVIPGQHHEKPRQIAKGVKIIHCPFSLSACIDLQVYDESTNKFWLGAHYVIPQNNDIIDTPLQLNVHDDAVAKLDSLGKKTHASSKIVVMLTGHSGRVVGGTRDVVNPAWISKWQLKRMGELVHDICDRLVYNSRYNEQPLELAKCIQIGQGTHFQYGIANEVLWGDILDFDPLIFKSYVDYPDGLSGQTAFEFPTRSNIFSAGNKVKLNLLFDIRTQHIELERLVRCPNNKVVWASVSSDNVRSEVSFRFTKQYWDAGPNNNGSHFFRAKVYASTGEMIGWDLGTTYLKDFEDSEQSMTPRDCLDSSSPETSEI